jgi:integrase
VLWAEIDTDAAVWIIPKDRMKAGKEHRVPLSEDALILLSKLPRTHKAVFPGMRGKPITTAATMKLLKQMRPGLTAHGFRSSFRDWAAEQTSVAGEIAEAALAHAVSNAVEAAYKRTDFFDHRRDLMDAWGRFATGQGGAEIVSLSARR